MKITPKFLRPIGGNFVEGISRVTFFTVLLLVTALFLRYDFWIITSPFQAEYREGAVFATTALLLKGQNPYQAVNQPLYTNVYGILYNLVVLPFAFLFGNSLWLHRLISGLAIFAAAALIGWVLVRKKVDLLYAASAGILFLSCQFFLVNPVARSDSLGVLFFLLALLLPWSEKYSSKSLVISGAIGVIAFYTKPYFVFSLAYLSVYLFLFVSKKKAILFAGLTLIGLLGTALLVWLVAPYYFYDTTFIHYHFASKSWNYMTQQVGRFFSLFEVTIVLALLLELIEAVFFLNKRAGISRIGQFLRSQFFDVVHFQRPLLAPLIDLPAFCFICSTLIVVYSFGQHGGSYMTYLFQLMTPFLSILLAQRFAIRSKYYVLNYLGILCTVVMMAGSLYPHWLNYSPAAQLNGWNRVAQILAESKNVLNSPALTSELIMRKIPFMDTGQNQYFFAGPVPELFFLPKPVQVVEMGDAFRLGIKQSLLQKGYDHVMIVQIPTTLYNMKDVVSNYQLEEKIMIEMPLSGQKWELEVWIPR